MVNRCVVGKIPPVFSVCFRICPILPISPIFPKRGEGGAGKRAFADATRVPAFFIWTAKTTSFTEGRLSDADHTLACALAAEREEPPSTPALVQRLFTWLRAPRSTSWCSGSVKPVNTATGAGVRNGSAGAARFGRRRRPYRSRSRSSDRRSSARGPSTCRNQLRTVVPVVRGQYPAEQRRLHRRPAGRCCATWLPDHTLVLASGGTGRRSSTGTAAPAWRSAPRVPTSRPFRPLRCDRSKCCGTGQPRIAGVLNFQLKDAASGGAFRVQHGPLRRRR